MTRAGQLKDSVTLQVKGADANGRKLGAWGSDVVRDARIVYINGGETALQGRLQGKPIAKITVRLGPDPDVAQVTTGWRAVADDGRIFDIKAVLPQESGDFVDFTAEQNGGPGGV